MSNELNRYLSGKTIILGIGNTLRSDDGAGSVLASRIKGRVPFTVIDAGPSPENYLEKIIKDKPDSVIIVDAADFGAIPGEFKLCVAKELRAINLFATHNVSIDALINYLQNNLKADIIVLIIQPKSTSFGDKLSREVSGTLDKIEKLLRGTEKDKG